MISVSLILVIIAVVLFMLAAFGLAASRVNLVALGLALWALSTILGGALG